MNRTISLLIIVLLISGCQIGNYRIEKISNDGQNESGISKVSVSELNLNPAQYDSQKIQIRGKLSQSGWEQRILIQDSDGLYIMVKDTIKERNYDSGSQYTAIGIFHNQEDLYKPFYLEATEPVKK